MAQLLITGGAGFIGSHTCLVLLEAGHQLLVLDDFRRAGKATDHDVTVGKKLAHVLAGGKVDPTETLTEDKLLNLERAAIVSLLRTSPTLDRIEHMLETGKPLRN